MKEVNLTMKKLLADNGIEAQVKYIDKGSLKGRYRIQNAKEVWYKNTALINKMTELGFIDGSGDALSDHSGNGGVFQVFVYYRPEEPEYNEYGHSL
jgi:hypothetical protein